MEGRAEAANRGGRAPRDEDRGHAAAVAESLPRFGGPETKQDRITETHRTNFWLLCVTAQIFIDRVISKTTCVEDRVVVQADKQV